MCLCQMSTDSFVAAIDISMASDGSSVAIVVIIAPDTEAEGSNSSYQPYPILTLNDASP